MKSSPSLARCATAALCLSVVTLLPTVAFAQTATTEPVGFVSDTIPANSDFAANAAHFTRASKFQGNVASISGTTITVAGTSPGWSTASPKEFEYVPGSKPDTFYLIIGSGAKAGQFATIVDNTANSVTVALNPGDNLSGIAANDQVRIIPFWTPKTLFPSTWPAGAQVLLYDGDVPGVDLAASRILSYTGTQWIDGATFESADELLIHPTDSFVIRNNANTTIPQLTLGNVPMIKHRALVSSLAANTDQDNRIAYSSPIPEVIGTTALGFQSGDQLLVFDNNLAGQDKSAAQILVFTGSGWLDQATFEDVTNTFTLQPGEGYVYRKVGTAAPQDIVWQDSQTYNP